MCVRTHMCVCVCVCVCVFVCLVGEGGGGVGGRELISGLDVTVLLFECESAEA